MRATYSTGMNMVSVVGRTFSIHGLGVWRVVEERDGNEAELVSFASRTQSEC